MLEAFFLNCDPSCVSIIDLPAILAIAIGRRVRSGMRNFSASRRGIGAAVLRLLAPRLGRMLKPLNRLRNPIIFPGWVESGLTKAFQGLRNTGLTV